MLMVIPTTRMPRVLGIRRLTMIHQAEAPRVSEAVTKSRALICSTRPRVARAEPIQPVRLMANIRVMMFPEPKTSINRIM